MAPPTEILPTSARSKAVSTNLPLGYARGFIIVMVVLHHSVLAYYKRGPQPVTSMVAAPRWWQAFPVVDPAKWIGYTPFIIFNDSYTMSLLFFLSGLFAWRSLKKRGAAAYSRNRLSRLGLPFLFMMLLAFGTYYTVYLQGGLTDGYCHEWLKLGSWPAGPAWFMVALLMFDACAVLLSRFASNAVEDSGRRIARIRNPYSMILLVISASLIPFIPSFLMFGFYSSGVFFFPITRVAHNAAYFLIGLALGSATLSATERDTAFMSPGGPLASHWLSLSAAAVFAFVLWQAINQLSHAHYASTVWPLFGGIGFCVSCAFSTFAVLSIFLRFMTRPHRVWDSLLACSFGIYIVHYFVVAWLQYPLLSVSAPGWFKGPLVFGLALGISWGIAALARRSKLIARFI